MKKTLIFALVILVGAFAAWKIVEKAPEIQAELGFGEAPLWLESDSARAIQDRIAGDFPLTKDQLLEQLQVDFPGLTEDDIDAFTAKHYLESQVIDGEERYFRKSSRNLRLLNPDFNGGARRRGDHASEARISYVDSVLNYYNGSNSKGLSHTVTYRFSIEVPGHDAIAGDSLFVWMPLPLNSDVSARQRDVRILDASPSDYMLSAGRSNHNSIFFKTIAPEPGDTARFEYVGRFTTSGAWMSSDSILLKMKDYDKESELYKRYTKVGDGRHIVRLDSLAHAIVGDETNPFRQSELVYDYIIGRYPWAGAREYSTIDCIPEYVIAEGHGDCGQVSLLYISLMRTLGVPARWESGWMLHPGEVNLHDWAEVYYEGIGWLPVDVSFGRYTTSDNPDVVGFYSHGIDGHRMAVNKAVGEQFFPAKQYVRSETVDFQVGEVETSKGNLYYPAWDYNMQIIDVKPVE